MRLTNHGYAIALLFFLIGIAIVVRLFVLRGPNCRHGQLVGRYGQYCNNNTVDLASALNDSSSKNEPTTSDLFGHRVLTVLINVIRVQYVARFSTLPLPIVSY
jgi:hypothetical protein